MSELLPSLVVTTTLAEPAAWGSVLQVMDVAELELIGPQAASPIVTAVADARLVPVMVTVLRPPNGPLLGLIEVTVGKST